MSHGDIDSAQTIQDSEEIPQAYVNYALLLPAIGVPFYVVGIFFISMISQ